MGGGRSNHVSGFSTILLVLALRKIDMVNLSWTRSGIKSLKKLVQGQESDAATLDRGIQVTKSNQLR